MFPVATMDHVRHQPGVVISFHALEIHCKTLLGVTIPRSQIKAPFHLIWFPGILWHFSQPLLATPDSPANSFLFMCAHLPQSQCHGCEPHNRAALAREKKCDWLAVAKVTFAVHRRRLSCLVILTCSGEKKAYFPSPDMKQ